MELKNKNILITGASTGIGKALAEKLVGLNCNLFLIARRDNLIKEYVNDLQDVNSKIRIFKCNTAIKSEVNITYELIKNEFNTIDVAILNAGIGYTTNIEDIDSERVEDLFGTNFFGAIYWIEKLLPKMILRKDGIIAGVSSLAESRGFSKSGAYSASKSALSIYLESLRVDAKKNSVKIITIKPGFVKTPMVSKNRYTMPFILTAEKAAGIIIRGLESEKPIIQFPLPTVLGAKLLKIIPDKLYSFLADKNGF